MNGHPSEKELFALFSELLRGKKRNSILSHLDECSECRVKYDSIRSMAGPYLSEKFTWSGDIRTRILQSYDRIAAETQSPWRYRLPAFLLTHYRITLTFSFAMMLIIISAILIYRREPSQINGSAPLSIVQITGTPEVNGKPAGLHMAAEEKSLFLVPGNSMIELSLEDAVSIKIGGSSIFSIDEAVSHDFGKRLVYRFTLREGTVAASFNHSRKHMSYSFSTPQAGLHSIGTEFLLQVLPGKTNVIMKSGSLKLRIFRSAKEIVATEKNKYQVTSSIITLPVLPADRELYNRINSFRNSGIGNSAGPELSHDIPVESSDNGAVTDPPEKESGDTIKREIIRDREDLKNETRKTRRDFKEGFKNRRSLR